MYVTFVILFFAAPLAVQEKAADVQAPPDLNPSLPPPSHTAAKFGSPAATRTAPPPPPPPKAPR
jgi:hypothetical protein